MSGSTTVRTFERNDELFVTRRIQSERLEDLTARRDAGEEGLDRLISRAQRALGDTDTDLVVANRGLVHRIARKFCARATAFDAEDFEGAGHEGLIKAIQSYDPSKGKFSSWAYQHISAAIQREVKRIDYSGLSHAEFEGRPEVRAVRDHLLDAGIDATPERIADEVDLNPEQVARILNYGRAASLDAPVGDEDGGTLADLLDCGDVSLEDVALTSAVVGALR